MDTNDLQNLLDRYRSGDITPDELDRLGELSGRDEIVPRAVRRARAIRLRRSLGAVAAVAIVALFATIGVRQIATPHLQNTEPTVAQSVATPEPMAEPSGEAEADEVAAPEMRPAAVGKPRAKRSQPALMAAVPASKPIATQAAADPAPEAEARVERLAPCDEPTVLCNTQCNADSVISDIWKFLKA